MLPHITYMHFYVAEHTFHTNSTFTIIHHHPSTLLMNELWFLISPFAEWFNFVVDYCTLIFMKSHHKYYKILPSSFSAWIILQIFTNENNCIILELHWHRKQFPGFNENDLVSNAEHSLPLKKITWTCYFWQSGS